jgi:hypothetical protein
MTTDRTCAVNALTALLRSNDMELDARKSLTGTQILEVSRWRTREEPQKDQPKRSPPVRETLARPTDLLKTQRQQSPAIATLTTIEESIMDHMSPCRWSQERQVAV